VISYSNVMATVAVFVALGGTGYAATQLTGRDIRDGTISTKDVKNRSLLKKDFKPGQLPRGKTGATGATGAQGIQGLQGPKGDTGPAGPTAAAFGGTALDPDENPETVVAQQQIDLPAAGRLVVQASTSGVSGTCEFENSFGADSSGDCVLEIGLYVDGTPVPQTRRAYLQSCNSASSTCSATASSGEVSLAGMTGQLAAGTHDIQLSAFKVASGNGDTNSVASAPPDGEVSVGGIFVGG
jgi:hypothetical protein